MKQFLLYSCFVLLLTSCYKEDALTPTEEDHGYVVPQGNHDYDNYIVDFYKRYGKYILYEFQDQDVYWTPIGWRKASVNSGGFWTIGPEVEKADPDYVGSQLKLIDTTWFRYYSESFIKAFLPVKIMLCKSVDSIYPTIVSYTPVTFGKGVGAVASWFNYDNISVNYGNATVTGLTAAQVKKVGAKLNLVFMQSINDRKLITATQNFASIANYGTTLSSQAVAYQQGIISPYATSPNATLDWAHFMFAMVSMNETNLKAGTAATNATYWGILNATKDVNGRIRQRYNMVRNYYIEKYNVDLQAIGNAFN